MFTNNLFWNNGSAFIPGQPIFPCISLNGVNNYTLANNTYNYYEFPFVSGFTGSYTNQFKCNETIGTTFYDLYYYAENSQSQFLENTFAMHLGVPISNVALNESSVNQNIGSPTNPAGNTWTDCELGGVSSYSEILTMGNSPFAYHHYNQIDCHEPNVTAANIMTIGSFNEFDNCNSQVGIFNLIDPDGDGETGLDPDYDPNTACVECLENTIYEMQSNIAQLVSNTDINKSFSSFSTTTSNLNDIRNQLQEWVNFAVYILIDRNQTNDAIRIVSSLTDSQEWNKILFGLVLTNGDLNQASTILDNMDGVSNYDDEIFVSIQRLNLIHIESNINSNSPKLTKIEINKLYQLAEEHTPSAGYGRSLYRIVTGNEVPHYEPEIIDQNNADQNSELAVETLAKVYPNPLRSGSKLSVDSNHQIKALHIFDKMGNTTQLDLNSPILNHEPGLYFIRIVYENGKEEIQRLLITIKNKNN